MYKGQFNAVFTLYHMLTGLRTKLVVGNDSEFLEAMMSLVGWKYESKHVADQIMNWPRACLSGNQEQI